MSSTKTGETAQLTVNKSTADIDTSNPTDKSALFPWTSLSQEEILHEIQKGIKNLTGHNKDSLKLLLLNRVEEEAIANIDKASAANTASTAILTPFGCFPAIKATNNSIRTTTPSSPATSDQPSLATKPTDATAPENVNQAIVNQAPETEEEDIWARALGVSIHNRDPTVSTTAAADPTNNATKLDAAGQPHYTLEDLLEDSTSATKTPENATLVIAAVEEDSSSGSGSDNPGSIDSDSDDDDKDDLDEMENHDDYEQGYSDGYYNGQDDAYNDYSDHQDDYYD